MVVDVDECLSDWNLRSDRNRRDDRGCFGSRIGFGVDQLATSSSGSFFLVDFASSLISLLVVLGLIQEWLLVSNFFFPRAT